MLKTLEETNLTLISYVLSQTSYAAVVVSFVSNGNSILNHREQQFINFQKYVQIVIVKKYSK